MFCTNWIFHWPDTDELSISKKIVVVITVEVLNVFIFDAFSVIPNKWNGKFVVPLGQNFGDFRVIKNLFSLHQFKDLCDKLVLADLPRKRCIRSY